jgi:hypothetical protein
MTEVVVLGDYKKEKEQKLREEIIDHICKEADEYWGPDDDGPEKGVA